MPEMTWKIRSSRCSTGGSARNPHSRTIATAPSTRTSHPRPPAVLPWEPGGLPAPSAPKVSADLSRDIVHLVLTHVGIHRQRYTAARDSLGHREGACLVSKVGENRLQVKGNRIVKTRGDAALGEKVDEGLAILHQHHIDMPDWNSPGNCFWQDQPLDAAQRLLVPSGHDTPASVPLFELLE